MKLISTNPAKNYEKLGEIEITAEREIDEIVKKATKAKKNWKEIGITKRIEILRIVVEKLKENKEHLALIRTREMGMPITKSREDISDAIAYFNEYLNKAEQYLAPEVVYEDNEMVHTVYHEPLGTAAVISPWNYHSNLVWNCGQTLIAGNTIIFKYSEECPLYAKALEDIFTQSDLPEGVFNVIYGDRNTGAYLADQNVDLICFTGSTKVGQQLYKTAAAKFIKAVLEMGGSAPGIVCEDADVPRILDSIYKNRFGNSGQSCDALKRLIVHESQFEAVVSQLKNLLESKIVGDPEDEETDLGPLVAKRQLELLESQVADAIVKGATVVTGGKQPNHVQGAFYEPTILTNVTRDMRVWQEEVFGPVMPVMTFKTNEEAVQLANDTMYGLGGYVYTENQRLAVSIAEQLETGNISINNSHYYSSDTPFGGYKKSGIGREHGKYGFGDVTQIKVIATEKK